MKFLALWKSSWPKKFNSFLPNVGFKFGCYKSVVFVCVNLLYFGFSYIVGTSPCSFYLFWFLSEGGLKQYLVREFYNISLLLFLSSKLKFSRFSESSWIQCSVLAVTVLSLSFFRFYCPLYVFIQLFDFLVKGETWWFEYLYYCCSISRSWILCDQKLLDICFGWLFDISVWEWFIFLMTDVFHTNWRYAIWCSSFLLQMQIGILTYFYCFHTVTSCFPRIQGIVETVARCFIQLKLF